jgi:murein DD-endopeptidase MepM/ murein hydrolase activator NlpD
MNFKTKALIFLSSLFLSTVQVFASPLPYNNPINGGVAIIPIKMIQKPEVFYKDKRVAVVPSNVKDTWLIIAGIPLEAKNSIQEMFVTKPYKGVIPFHINQKQYKKQFLSIDNKRKVDPHPEDEQRIAQEKETMSAAFAAWQASQPFKSKFIAPVKGRISSQFGLQRILNNKPKNRHTGLDIAAYTGTPIKATAKGEVIVIGDFFYTGNTVIIDHGQGLFSLYAHLNKINVSQGQTVKQGKVIGTVGATGRVTGPHLHWSMIMNQTFVDPLMFVPAKEIVIKPKAKPKKAKKQS